MRSLGLACALVLLGCGPAVTDSSSGEDAASSEGNDSVVVGTGDDAGCDACLSCDELCPFIVPAACPAGPPDAGACVTGCEASRTGPCAADFSEVRTCIGMSPAFACDESGRPVVAGCEAEFAALYICLGL